MPDTRSKRTALDPLVNAWGRIDPEAALKWVMKEEVGRAADVRSLVRTDLFHAWSRKDPEGALRWAETWAKTRQPADRNMADVYLDTLAGNGSERVDRASAANLYAKIEDGAIRTRMLTKHVREWLTHDDAAARTWLESNNTLTPDQAAALLAPIR